LCGHHSLFSFSSRKPRQFSRSCIELRQKVVCVSSVQWQSVSSQSVQCSQAMRICCSQKRPVAMRKCQWNSIGRWETTTLLQSMVNRIVVHFQDTDRSACTLEELMVHELWWPASSRMGRHGPLQVQAAQFHDQWCGAKSVVVYTKRHELMYSATRRQNCWLLQNALICYTTPIGWVHLSGVRCDVAT